MKQVIKIWSKHHSGGVSTPALHSKGLDSNLCPETDYPESGFLWFISVSPQKCWDSTSNWAVIASFHISSNLNSSYHLKLTVSTNDCVIN